MTACRGRGNADCLDAINARPLLDHNSQLADEVGHLLEFDLVAYDVEGNLINRLSQTLQLPLSDSTYQQMQKGPFRFFQQLDLPPGEVFLRVGIRDLTSNKIGTLEVPLNVPKSPPDRAAAAPAN